jgi:hypothetical protein
MRTFKPSGTGLQEIDCAAIEREILALDRDDLDDDEFVAMLELLVESGSGPLVLSR